MTYIISGLGGRVGGLGNLGAVGGDGTEFSPFGGVGGDWGTGGAGDGPTRAVKKLAAAGVVFSDPPAHADKFQEGLFNNEKYIFVRGTFPNTPAAGKDAGKTYFYKFHVPNSVVGGDGSKAGDDKAQAWFNATYKAGKATAPKTVVSPLPGPGVSIRFPSPVSEASSGGGKTMLVLGAAAAIATVVLVLNERKKRKSSAA